LEEEEKEGRKPRGRDYLEQSNSSNLGEARMGNKKKIAEEYGARNS